MSLSAYARLGLPEQAGLDAAKAAYRRLVKTCHPDIAGDNRTNRARFEEISTALREIEAATRHREAASAGKPTPRSVTRNLPLVLTLEEAVNGTTRRIEIRDGLHSLVRIPPGMEHGAVLRVPGLEARSPDPLVEENVLLRVEIAAHDIYRVSGGDIFLLLQVEPALLAKGGVVDAPTPHGLLRITIEKGAKPGQVLRLRGKGLPARAGRAEGTLYVTLKVGERTKAINAALNAFTKAWSRRKPAA